MYEDSAVVLMEVVVLINFVFDDTYFDGGK